MSIKNTIAVLRWKSARNKVDNAVSVLASAGVGYSRTEGIIGTTAGLSEKEIKKVNAAADTMQKYQAAYFTEKQKFTPDKAIAPTRYTPLRYAFTENAQIKAYEQATTSAHLRAGLKILQRTNFDPRLQSHPNRRILKLTPEEAQEWAANVESLWRDDKTCKEWDESLQNDYTQLSDMALWGYVAIGEIFAIRRLYNDPERGVNVSIQMISPFQVQSPYFYSMMPVSIYDYSKNYLVAIPAGDFLSKLENGNYIESGIEYNAKNQEVAIYITTSENRGWLRIPIYTESGFQQVIHGFIQQEPGQRRGIPESATAWHEYANIKDLQLFELESARLNTVVAGAVTADSNAQPNGKNPISEVGWSDLDPVDSSQLQSYQEPSYSVRKVEGGGFILQNFTPGYKYQELDTKRPNQNIPLYIEKLLEFISPSVHGISVVVTKQRFDGSYNASKGAIDLSWKNGIEYILKQFTSDWHKPNYDAWLNSKIATGEVSAPGWENIKKKRAWSSMSIITPPKPSLNPKQEADASKTRISEGISNREYESQQTTGTSAEENAERLLSENQKLAEAKKVFAEPENPDSASDNGDMEDDIENLKNGGNNAE